MPLSVYSPESGAFFFRLRTDAPWGDYGSILASGMVVAPFRRNGELCLSRTGPFVPTITFPSRHVVVTTEGKSMLTEEFGVRDFVHVQKQHIVRLDWHTWDRNGDLLIRPLGDEPENYLVYGDHCQMTAAALGEFWEPCLSIGAKARVVGASPLDRVIKIIRKSWKGADLFTISPTNWPIPVVTGRGKEIIESFAPEFIKFESLAEDP